MSETIANMALEVPVNAEPQTLTSSAEERLTAVAIALVLFTMLTGLFWFFSSTMRLVTYGMWLAVLVGVARLTQMRGGLKVWRPIAGFVALQGLYAVIGTLVSPVPEWREAFRIIFFSVTLGGSVAVLCSTAALKRILSYSIVGAMWFNLACSLGAQVSDRIQSLMAGIQSLALDTQLQNERMAGFLGNPNEAGVVAVMAFIVAGLCGWRLRWASRAGAVVMVYLTASRGAAYALLAAMAVAVLARFIRRGALGLVLAVGGGSLAILVLVTMSVLGASGRLSGLTSENKVLARMSDFSEANTSAMGESTRLDVIRMWLPYMRDRFWTGHGLEAQCGGGIYGGDSLGQATREDIPYIGVHNQYLGWMIDLGVFGFLAYVGFFLWRLAGSLRRALGPGANSVVLQLWALLGVTGMVNHNLIFIFYGLILIGLILCLDQSEHLPTPASGAS
jgi:O-antigen ligase